MKRVTLKNIGIVKILTDIHPISDEVYDTLLLLVQGKFEVPVSKRTRIQRNTILEKKRGLSFTLDRKERPRCILQPGKKVVWRLQKATISSGLQLCGFKSKEGSSSYEQ